MIITCPSCKKKFNIDTNLIPIEGRDLQCGSCEHIWFYKKKNHTSESVPVKNKDTAIKENEDINELDKEKFKTQLIKQSFKEKNNETHYTSDIKKTEKKPQITKKTQSNKFFSYLIVFIISIVTLIILLDTLKTPLINVFPGLEVLLFNLYETLQDIKLFIIDLI
tara:strand:- start:392 stop:886 length:495 start_codon:yes stop_codon:yes gene_type:complete